MLRVISDDVSLDDFAQECSIAAGIVNTVFFKNIYAVIVSLIKDEVDHIIGCKYLSTVFNQVGHFVEERSPYCSLLQADQGLMVTTARASDSFISVFWGRSIRRWLYHNVKLVIILEKPAIE